VAHLFNRTTLSPATDYTVAGAFLCLETESEEPMNRKSEQYRFARIEGYRITLMCLEEQFKDRVVNLDKMEAVAIEQLAKENLCVPWRRSETERAGCREGMRLAAIEFLSQYREALRNFRSNGLV
jgi:hypothetical protein